LAVYAGDASEVKGLTPVVLVDVLQLR
jgi:hypothetical protein